MSTNYKKIAVAIDFSAQSLKALEQGIKLTKDSGALLQLVTVIDTKSFGSITAYDLKYADQMKEKYEKKMDELKGKVSAEGVSQVETIVKMGSPKEILTTLPEVDLIVIGSTGLNQLEKIIIGSVAERVVRHAAYDVLLVR